MKMQYYDSKLLVSTVHFNSSFVLQHVNMTTYNVKLCLLGDTEVGKTCIALRYVENKFKEVSNTIGASFLCKTVETEKKTVYKLNIWDTAGEER